MEGREHSFRYLGGQQTDHIARTLKDRITDAMTTTLSDLELAALGGALLALLSTVVSSSFSSYHFTRPVSGLQLQRETLLDTSSTAEECTPRLVRTRRSSIMHSFVAFALYVCMLMHVVRALFDRSNRLWQTLAVNASTCLLLGLLTEVESLQLSGPIAWRVRAMLRCAGAVALAFAHVGVASGLLSGDAGDPSALDWPLAALDCAAALLLLMCAAGGRANFEPLPSTEDRTPPLREAGIMAKLFYTYWLRDVVRYFRIDRRGGEQLCLADLPMLDPAQATATCWAAAPTGAEPGRSLLLMLLLTVVRTELKLQVGWASMSLLLAYAGPFGMYVLLDEVARASTGSKLSGAMVLAGAAVALGPLAKAVADAQTFLNGWAMGTKLRAYLTRAICRKALVTDQAATGSWSIGEITNLLAVDINNILNFSPGGSWLVLEVVQLFTT